MSEKLTQRANERRSKEVKVDERVRPDLPIERTQKQSTNKERSRDMKRGSNALKKKRR